MKQLLTAIAILTATNLFGSNANLNTSAKQTDYDKFCSTYNKKEMLCAKSQLEFTDGTSFWNNGKLEVSAKASSMLSGEGKLSMNYAELLTVAKHDLTNKVFITAGTFTSKNINHKTEVTEDKSETQLQSYVSFAKRNIKALDFGSIVSIGYKASRNLIVNAGLSNSFSKLTHPFQQSDKAKTDLKLGVSYFFGKK